MHVSFGDDLSGPKYIHRRYEISRMPSHHASLCRIGCSLQFGVSNFGPREPQDLVMFSIAFYPFYSDIAYLGRPMLDLSSTKPPRSIHCQPGNSNSSPMWKTRMSAVYLIRGMTLKHGASQINHWRFPTGCTSKTFLF